MKPLLLFTLILLTTACSTTEVLMQSGDIEKYRSVKKYVKHSPTLNQYYFGMQLYDIDEKKVLFHHQDDHYFTPASVTKWLTLYTATNYLTDSLAWLNVYNINNKLVFQPMGDPSFLHPDLKSPDAIRNYFDEIKQDTIYWSENHFKDLKYGSGWAWDDYTYYFQPQKSAFPIHSNLIRFNKDTVSPTFIPSETYYNLQTNKPARLWGTNQFFIDMPDTERFIPFEVNHSILKNFFVEKHKVFQPYDDSVSQKHFQKTVYSIPAIEAYKILMQKSDNHIAEQLLLQASQTQLKYMKTKDIIAYTKKDILSSLSDELQWVDGSGLSRYNMLTPNAVVNIINRMVDERGIEWLQEVLPVGGKSGTIKNHYLYDVPRVYAKTGTLRHNHNLAGLVQAKSGKWYSFCMMNNHYKGSSKIAKKEMDNILKIVVENY